MTTESRKVNGRADPSDGQHERHGAKQAPGKPEPTLARTPFVTSRLMEFFTVKELTMQIGHPIPLWPLALVRELIDNALDACEKARVSPAVSVIVEPDAVTVMDNGPGLPPEVLKRSLDYAVRVSDKSHYVSPTRGQLGNALKCVWAAPFVADGARGRAEVVTRGERHVIDVSINRLDQEPKLQHQRSPADGLVRNGTLVRIHWPKIACFLDGTQGHGFYNAARLLSACATFNPHATLELRTADGPEMAIRPGAPSWQKWLPSRPTSPHWYTPEALRALIAAYIAAERAGAKPKTVREFVSEFYGLTGTAKQKKVVGAAGLANAALHDLVTDNDVDAQAVARLLNAMVLATRPVKARALGVIGEPHLTASLVDQWSCSPDSVRYKRVLGEVDGLPFVLEVALGVNAEDDERGRQIIAGVNWSPALVCPFDDLTYQLGEMRVDEFDPVTVAVHLACPRLDFTDRGKGKLALPDDMAEALEKCVRSVARPWKEEKRQTDREGRLRQQQLEKLRKSRQTKRVTQKDAAYQVMEEAYLHASGDKSDPANARQVMYAARPRVMELTGGECWSKSSYFTQTLLPKFIEAHPELTADWNVVFDARGRLIEPHTGRRIDLGTLEVRNYIQAWTPTCPDRPSGILVPTSCPTHGPANRYRFALFVEKEGFYPLLERYRIADRYDVAIMSTKGMSVTAARELVDRLSEQGVTILVLRDFDKSGFSIVNTLRTDSPRYKFRVKPTVVDIGLRLEDVHEWGLLSLAEPVDYRNAKKDPREVLRAAGATEEECRFLVNDRTVGGWSGQRVELNAFTSPRFIEFTEYKFKKQGVAKLVPAGESLESAYRRAYAMAQIQGAIDEATAEALKAGSPAMPRGLPSKLAKAIKDTGKSWDEALAEIVRERRAKQAR
jgi:DNA topoisomerase VI subunit B